MPMYTIESSPSRLALAARDASNLIGNPAGIVHPESHDEVVQIVRGCHQRRQAFVARGAGTGLAGGAVPSTGALVISLRKMNRILEVDPAGGWAWVEPGVLNADVSRSLAHLGLHFAPDPSSQQSCTIGGNVANNSGGPHCLADGVTSAHILEMKVVYSDGTDGHLTADNHGVDLRGAFVGSEGMFGIATAIKIRLTQSPPHVSTMLFGFPSVDSGARAVSEIIAHGIVPAALEMMDAPITRAVEDYVHAGFPLDAAAVLIVEVDGLRHAVAEQVRAINALARQAGASSARTAADDSERALIWKGRKTAFGAIARIKPNYYLHDTVVPRRRLADVLATVYEIATAEDLQVMNVFHAGDGNLHPLLLFDRRESGVMDRVHRAGDEIVRVSLEAGGVLSGEHGIGLEKQHLMALMFDPQSLAHQSYLRRAFDPHDLANPGKVLPSTKGCGYDQPGLG
jgi:glycolate oxidase